MTVTVSLALVFGAAALLMLKFGSLKFGAGIVAVLFGFYLASTDAAPNINNFVASVTNSFSGIGF